MPVIDSTTMQMFARMGEAFGIPVGWLALGASTAIGFVNTLKSLAPNLLASDWYPAVAFTISAAYSYVTLRPSWTVIAAGTVVLFVVQWITWMLAKKSAVAAGKRPA